MVLRVVVWLRLLWWWLFLHDGGARFQERITISPTLAYRWFVLRFVICTKLDERHSGTANALVAVAVVTNGRRLISRDRQAIQ